LCCHSRIVSGSCCPEGCSETKTYQWDSEISRCRTDSNNSGLFDLFAPSACCVREHDAAYTATKRFYSDENCTNETGFVEQTIDNETGCIAERRYQDGIGQPHILLEVPLWIGWTEVFDHIYQRQRMHMGSVLSRRDFLGLALCQELHV